MAFAQSEPKACMHKANEISRCFKNAHTDTVNGNTAQINEKCAFDSLLQIVVSEWVLACINHWLSIICFSFIHHFISFRIFDHYRCFINQMKDRIDVSIAANRDWWLEFRNIVSNNISHRDEHFTRIRADMMDFIIASCVIELFSFFIMEKSTLTVHRNTNSEYFHYVLLYSCLIQFKVN